MRTRLPIFAEVAALFAAKKGSRALDAIYQGVDALIFAGDVPKVREILEAACAEVPDRQFPLSTFMSLLVVTRRLDDPEVIKQRSALAEVLHARAVGDLGEDGALELRIRLF